ncbi:pyridoxal phosphate-dependent transferase [Xylariaceae sp. FL0662B]|nr:pyridoxal phosphate-dependent transferase [Xylariaceae sp. FL0662B]
MAYNGTMAPNGTDDYFLGDRPTDEVLEFFNQVVQLGTSFKGSNQVISEPTRTPNDIAFQPIPNEGVSLSQLLDHFKDLAQKSSNWGSPTFLGFPDSGNSIPGLVPPKYMSSAGIGGILTLGGCLSNTIALVAAREKLFPQSSEGLPVLPKRVRVLVPDAIEHYSIRSAMSWLGLGQQNVVRIPVNDKFRMDLEYLKKIINGERRSGNYILACVAYAGDSRSMNIEDLDPLAAVLAERDVWFHVDACHGSQLAFSYKYRDRLRGIEKADSITIDPHKVLWLPYTCSFVLFKDPKALAEISTNSDLILKTQWSLGQVTPFIGSKAFDALKIWATIKFFGQDKLSELIDQRLELTAWIQQDVNRRGDLVLLHSTDINSCIMAFIPSGLQKHYTELSRTISYPDLEKLNEINYRIKEIIRADGTYYIHGFMLKSCPHALIEPQRPVYVLRTMNGNPRTTTGHVKRLLDRVEELGWTQFGDSKYQLLSPINKPNIRSQVITKLDILLEEALGQTEYAAVLYGSSATYESVILSDIDLMVFVPDLVASDMSIRKALQAVFLSVMAEAGVLIDAEVPFDRKLVISSSFALKAAGGKGIKIVDGRITSILKTPQYLASDEMLERLILNVLTTPSRVISGSTTMLTDLTVRAEDTLVRIIAQANPGELSRDAISALDAQKFVRLAMSDGRRSGEDYLGYKNRDVVALNLNNVFMNVLQRSQHTYNCQKES